MKLHTTIKGKGAPIVFLHTELETGATEYEYQSNHFSNHNQVIRPDLRGHGNSLSDQFSDYFNDAAADLNETLEHLGVVKAPIIGTSLGALVAIVFARRFPEKVKSLTISGVMAKKPANWKTMHAREIESKRKLLRDDKAVEYYNHLHNTNWRDVIYMMRERDWYPFDQTANLSDIGVPVLYIGAEDHPQEVDGIRIYHKMSNVHIALLPFASRFVHQDQPELYTQILDQFLQK